MSLFATPLDELRDLQGRWNKLQMSMRFMSAEYKKLCDEHTELVTRVTQLENENKELTQQLDQYRLNILPTGVA